MENLGINYLSANEAGLIMHIETRNGEIIRRADTLEDGINLVDKYGLADTVMGSSSMDFGTEEGFTKDSGPKDFWNAIIKVSQARGLV
jgi:hypothetical protein|tara:strand:- start:119 stop:382 length:264 start_codon:yes stop_codon:yes gene_type:complete